MEIARRWLHHRSGLHRIFSGELSISDILEDSLELHASSHFSKLRYMIEDYRQATNRPFSAEDLQMLTDFVELQARTKSALKLAIISRDTPESLAAADYFCTLMSRCHYQCRVFTIYEEAELWAASGCHSE